MRPTDVLDGQPLGCFLLQWAFVPSRMLWKLPSVLLCGRDAGTFVQGIACLMPSSPCIAGGEFTLPGVRVTSRTQGKEKKG